MAVLIGVLIALAVCAGAGVLGLGRERAFYPTVMMVVAHYYVLFALLGGANCALLREAMVMVAFIVVAVAGFKTTRWLVVAAFAAHGGFDLLHGHLIVNPGMPPWWPPFCLSCDVVMALWLAATLIGNGSAREILANTR